MASVPKSKNRMLSFSIYALGTLKKQLIDKVLISTESMPVVLESHVLIPQEELEKGQRRSAHFDTGHYKHG